MSQWRHTMVDGAEFWITCKRLKLLRKAHSLQLIQNSAPSNIVLRQCDIRIWRRTVLCPFFTLNILSIFEHNLFYLSKNHSHAQVFQKNNYWWIKQFSKIHDYFFIQAVVPSQNILQAGEAQKSNETILDAFICSQIKCFFHSQKNCFYFHSQINVEIHFANKTKLCN